MNVGLVSPVPRRLFSRFCFDMAKESEDRSHRRGKKRRESSKHREKYSHSHGEKKKTKHSEEKRHGIQNRRRSRSPVDGGTESEWLERGRAAFHALRELLGYNYDLKDEMKELIRQLDAGKRLDVSGIPDTCVLEKVSTVFDNISLIRRSRDGTYKSRYQDSNGAIMKLLDPIFNENPEDLKRLYDQSVRVNDALPHRDGPTRRHVGPMRPSFAESKQAELLMKQINTDDTTDELLGPVMPEILEEDLEESTDAKLQLVGRIVNLVKQHKEKGLTGKDQASILPNPYQILDIDRNASPSEIKRRFLKLSLMVHPDKCSHPCAPIAFEAVSTAAKRLQDTAERATADKEVEYMQNLEIVQALNKEKQREDAWRVARGEKTNEVAPPLRREREAWMTTAPTKGTLSNLQSRSFQSRAAPDHDESWTQTPGKKQVYSCIGPNVGPSPMNEVYASDSAKVPEANRKSLLEKHAEQMHATKTAKMRHTEIEGRPEKEYKPFNRETDLELKRSVDPHSLLKNMKGLSSRFGKGSS